MAWALRFSAQAVGFKVWASGCLCFDMLLFKAEQADKIRDLMVLKPYTVRKV